MNRFHNVINGVLTTVGGEQPRIIIKAKGVELHISCDREQARNAFPLLYKEAQATFTNDWKLIELS